MLFLKLYNGSLVSEGLHRPKTKRRKGVVARVQWGVMPRFHKQRDAFLCPGVSPVSFLERFSGVSCPDSRTHQGMLAPYTLYLSLGEIEHGVGVRRALDVVLALIFAEEARVDV